MYVKQTLVQQSQTLLGVKEPKTGRGRLEGEESLGTSFL